MYKPEINCYLAPMAELTHLPLRRVVRSFSPKTIMTTEMLSAASVVNGGFKNNVLMQTDCSDRPLSWQILGNSPDMMSLACEKIEKYHPYAVDINMGCSAPDIRRSGFGSALMKKDNRVLTSKIVKACRNKTNSLLTAKIRIGFDDYNVEDFLSFCKMLEDEGVDAIAVHGRTAKQAFKRKSNWTAISTLKNNLKVPIIGNGDIETAADAIRKAIEYGPDAVMIGRGAIVRPWIFREIELIEKGQNELIDLLDVCTRVLNGIKELLPEEYHKSRGRRFCSYFSKNLKFGHNLFASLRNATEPDSMINCFREYYKNSPGEKIELIGTTPDKI